MSTPSTSSHQHLTLRQLINLAAPMVLSFVMMSGAAPIVTGGIAWKFGPQGESLHLSAFLVCFMSAMLLYSPVFVTREISIRTVTDSASKRQYLRFFTTVSGACSLLLIVMSQVTPLNVFFYERLIGVDSLTRELACEGLVYFVPLPFLISLRSYFQSRHINQRTAWYNGAGTAVRLVAMAVFVFGFAVHMPDMTGPVLGGSTFLIGLSFETLFVFLTAHRHRLPIGNAAVSTGTMLKFAGPLILSAITRMIIPMVLIRLITVTTYPEEGRAGYDLMRSTLWLSLSIMYAMQPTIVSCATSRQNLQLLRRASIVLAVFVACCFTLVAFTPLHRLLFVDLMDLDNVLIQMLLFDALPWAAALPLIVMTDVFLVSLHLRAGSTIWVWAGRTCGLVVLLLVASLADLSAFNGVKLVVFAEILQHLASVTLLSIGMLKQGIERSLHRGTVAESMA
ncbi:MAG: hypothetical protein QGF67_15430 [Lentisphaeria bacterium]|jgi:hypothetical protein|nr:hypothetical protein [Lentisphaeria bacterium]MDP7742830.1 hypothetical protein [Lentisphaeria bacterium]